MATIQTLRQFQNELETIYPASEAAIITQWILEKVTGKSAIQLRVNPIAQLTLDEQRKLNHYLALLKTHMPVQYVLEEAWFYKRKFFVNKDVLIPRPETEELVTWIIETVQANGRLEKAAIIDIGTGSGCIPISIKKELPLTIVSAIDVSVQALLVAEKNASELGADVEFIEMDFLSEENWESLPSYEIIVCNPPYIPLSEKTMIDKHVRDFEPGTALFVKTNNPFIFYEKTAVFARKHLMHGGFVFVEVHEQYAGEVKAIFEKHSFQTELRKDMYGKDRMLCAH